ncbi:hypothetical protein V8C42DRAFT_190691 [Trichoderma barbatum]
MLTWYFEPWSASLALDSILSKYKVSLAKESEVSKKKRKEECRWVLVKCGFTWPLGGTICSSKYCKYVLYSTQCYLSTPSIRTSTKHQYCIVSSAIASLLATQPLDLAQSVPPGNPEPLCSVSPQVLAISGSGSITRCYDARTYDICCLYEGRRKKVHLCRGNSSRLFRRSRCKFNGRHTGATAASYLDSIAGVKNAWWSMGAC